MNDAPALKKANVGIAVAGATAAAKGAADIILTEVAADMETAAQCWLCRHLRSLSHWHAHISLTCLYKLHGCLGHSHISKLTAMKLEQSDAVQISCYTLLFIAFSSLLRPAHLLSLQEGIGTIITAISRSRMIFRRLETYIVYRIASSLLILGFFFFAIVILEFEIPTWVLVSAVLVQDDAGVNGPGERDCCTATAASTSCSPA